MDPSYVSPSVQIPGKNRPGLFRSIWVQPTGEIYETLEKDEAPILLLNQHWISHFFRIVAGLILAVAPFIAAPIILGNITSTLVAIYILVFLWFWISFVLLYFIAMFVLWESNVFLITNERVINFDTNLLFLKRARDSELGYLHQVDYKRPEGLIRGSFEYGDVFAKFSGDEFEVRMPKIPKPEQIALALGELAEQARQREGRHAFQHTGEFMRTP